MTLVKNEWFYYNSAYIPRVPPDQTVDTTPVRTGEIWEKGYGKAYLARWTSEFDNKEYKHWWYVIKDTPFDIGSLKAKRRYEINRGNKNFYIKQILSNEYIEEMCDAHISAYSVYPRKYRPSMDREVIAKRISEMIDEKQNYVFGAFDYGSNKLCGYAQLSKQQKCIHFSVLKTDPKYEKLSVNAAIVAYVLEYFNGDIGAGAYICDGARNVQHETAFQDYLEKYFGFRKAYCRLNIAYNPRYKLFVKMLYPFKALLRFLDCIGIVHKINGVLKMEEIVRIQQKDLLR